MFFRLQRGFGRFSAIPGKTYPASFFRIISVPRVLGGSMVRHLRFPVLCAILLAIAFAGSSSLQGQTSATPPAIPVATEFNGLHFRSIGPASMSGRVADLAVYDANPAIYYIGTAHGGVWKTTSNGALLEPQLPAPGSDVDWRRHGVAARSESRLGRHRRVEQPAERVVGRRRLQVDRRRPEVGSHGAAGVAPHQPHRDRSHGQQHRLGCGHRPALGARRRTRRLQDDRRRPDLEERAEGR